MQNQIDNLRNLFDDKLNTVLQYMDKKADKGDLEQLDKMIVDKLNDVIKNIIERFADKKDTHKRLSALEKQIKVVYDLMISQESHRTVSGQEDDAMFTKKPLGGTSCASCEKTITNMHGQMAEYQAWKRLPFKEPGERISRVSTMPHLLTVASSMVRDSLRYCKC